MTDLLAVAGPEDADPQLVEQIASRRPDRVTVLVEDGDRGWALDDSPDGIARRDRLATLLHAVERRTTASVVGLAGDREQLFGSRFDGVVVSKLPLAA
jgi:hypothetical protein